MTDGERNALFVEIRDMLRERLEDHRRHLKHIETTLWDHSDRL